MTYHKEEYTLHNGNKIYALYDDQDVCQVTKECIEMLLDLYQQGRADAIDEVKDTIRDIHDNVANEMYCKGIDDIVKIIKERVGMDWEWDFYFIEEIAEKLKAGGKNE